MIAIVATSPPPPLATQRKNETKQNLLPMDDCQFGYKNKFLYKKTVPLELLPPHIKKACSNLFQRTFQND
jgi:hypothetical protein